MTDGHQPADLQPLQAPNEFRLIELEAGKADDALSCRLTDNTFQESEGHYVALSYTWGSTILSKSILREANVIPITENLHWALRRIRLRAKPRRVWCDALCIKQGDDAAALQDRAQQIPLMSRIFGSASRVLIDLGDDDGTLEEVTKAMNTILHAPQDARAQCFDEEDPAAYLGLSEYRDPMWSVLGKFWSRPWFQRLWCVQEAVLARNIEVMFGSYSIGWVELGIVASVWTIVTTVAVRKYQTTLGWDTQGVLHPLIAASSLIVTYQMRKAHLAIDGGSSPDLCSLVRSTLTQYTTDRRDRVYALYGMVGPQMADELPATYAESVDGLSQRLSRFLVGKGNGVWMLVHCGGVSPSRPSWTLNLERLGGKERNDPLCATTQSDGHNYNYAAGGVEVACLRAHPDEDCIRVRGLIVDTLSSMADTFQYPEDAILGSVGAAKVTTQFASSWAFWFDGMLDWAAQFRSSDPESLWRTLVADFNALKGNPEGPTSSHPTNEFGTYFDELVVWARSITRADPPIELERLTANELERIHIPPMGCKYVVMTHGSLLRRRVARTRAGAFALVPAASEITDVVAVFQGVPVPFVLRAVEDGYCVVGTCYVHDIMDGEAFSRGLQIENILLR